MTAATVRTRPAAKPNGWWGMTIFVATEATLFGTLIGSYFYLRFNTNPWPPAGTPEPRVIAPVLLTAALVIAGFGLYAALRLAGAGRRLPALGALAAVTCVQGAYLAVQLVLFSSDLDKSPPKESAYASIVATLSGASHAHVIAGLLLDLWLLVRLGTRLTPYRLTGLRVTALYWTVVNAITVAVLLTELSPHL